MNFGSLPTIMNKISSFDPCGIVNSVLECLREHIIHACVVELMDAGIDSRISADTARIIGARRSMGVVE